MIGLRVYVILFCLVVPSFGNEDETTLTCPPNEVVNKCANALCKIEYCKDIGQSVICAFVDRCQPGCNCREGYLRANNETCIPEFKCPPPELPHRAEKETAKA